MPDADSLRAAERRLQAAQLASDLDVIDMLVDDAALFTGPDGTLATKADDLAVHRSGHQKVARSEELDLRVLVHGSSGVTWFHGVLEGSLGGEPFGARLRYTRAWAHDGAAGWRVLAAHAAIVGPAGEPGHEEGGAPR